MFSDKIFTQYLVIVFTYSSFQVGGHGQVHVHIFKAAAKKGALPIRSYNRCAQAKAGRLVSGFNLCIRRRSSASEIFPQAGLIPVLAGYKLTLLDLFVEDESRNTQGGLRGLLFLLEL